MKVFADAYSVQQKDAVGNSGWTKVLRGVEDSVDPGPRADGPRSGRVLEHDGRGRETDRRMAHDIPARGDAAAARDGEPGLGRDVDIEHDGGLAVEHGFHER